MSNQNATAPVRKPVPVRDVATAGFFDGAKQGKLMVQRCPSCGHQCLTGTKYCPNCVTGQLEWVPASGKATLHTYALVHQKSHPAFADDVPYPVATVKLAEGPMMNLRLVGIPAQDLRIGMALKAQFIPNENAEPTPVFGPDRG